ncbi:kinase domain containing protein [Penicillium brasilianum]|uniref:Kinase domain containing protein n=1 Tax=Penicillium brasilianum TaxID=104259 RepID=A0A1S9RZX2_PENBI|nr:kinase domain containing protein [Penicillium brasilianum]
MREPLWIFPTRFVNRKIPLPLTKAYIYFLLVGLDYLHSECKVVYIDLKLGNILISFENEKILTDFIKRLQPMQYKVDDRSGRTIYLYHNNFGALDMGELKNIFPKIADFGNAIRLDKPSTLNGMVGEQVGVYPIQPDYYHAPENILGNKELFQQVHNTNCPYDAKSHLAVMIALLGPPPGALLAKSKAMFKHNWPSPITNDTRSLCNNAQEFFGSPFFNAEGWFTTISYANT